MAYWNEFRPQKPPNRNSELTTNRFCLVANERWKNDTENRERDEIAGPASRNGFRIVVEYELSDGLQIAKPKLTIFQIHSSFFGPNDREPCPAHPIFMFNIRPFSNAADDKHFDLHSSDIYWAGILNKPDHNKGSSVEWKPSFGYKEGINTDLRRFTIEADLKVRDLKIDLDVRIISESHSAIRGRHFPLLNFADVGKPSDCIFYPKFGAYRSSDDGFKRYPNRPDQCVTAKCIEFHEY
jgi:hypothetical protein